MKKIFVFACVALFAGSLMAQGVPQEQTPTKKENRKTEQVDKRGSHKSGKMMKDKKTKHSKKGNKKHKMMDKDGKMMEKKDGMGMGQVPRNSNFQSFSRFVSEVKCYNENAERYSDKLGGDEPPFTF